MRLVKTFLVTVAVLSSGVVMAEDGKYIGIDQCMLQYKITSNGLGNLGAGYLNLKSVIKIRKSRGDVKISTDRGVVTLHNDDNRMKVIVESIKSCIN